VHGAIAFYLKHQPEMDAYLVAQQERWNALREESEIKNAAIRARLRAVRSSQPATKDGS
jgi:hypothetical protein